MYAGFVFIGRSRTNCALPHRSFLTTQHQKEQLFTTEYWFQLGVF